MSNMRESSIVYFISLTHCERHDAIEFLEKTDWKLDESLNLFFEHGYKPAKANLPSRRIDGPSQQSSSKPIIIPTMIEFQQFIQSFHLYSTSLLENSSKIVNLAVKCATIKPVNIPSHEMEHWLIHFGVDRARLQSLLENEMCAPLVWIEHFDHLLNGNLCQLFDCDYMFHLPDYQVKSEQID